MCDHTFLPTATRRGVNPWFPTCRSTVLYYSQLSERPTNVVNTVLPGHPGSLCTVHSGGGGNRTINRLARLALQRGSGLSFDSLREEIMDAVDIIVYMVRSADGRRRIDTVTAVQSGTFRMLWRWTGQDFTRGERP